MIKKIGIDITNNERHKPLIKDEKKYSRILSKKEIAIFLSYSNEQRQIEYLASRFASKEALLKAYGKCFSFNQVSVLNKEDGSPYFEADFLMNEIVHLSISHESDSSIAIVIIEGA